MTVKTLRAEEEKRVKNLILESELSCLAGVESAPVTIIAASPAAALTRQSRNREINLTTFDPHTLIMFYEGNCFILPKHHPYIPQVKCTKNVAEAQ